jgi:hypothetical protein
MIRALFADSWKRIHDGVKDWWRIFIHYDAPPIPQCNFDSLFAFMRERHGYTREKAEGEIARRVSA